MGPNYIGGGQLFAHFFDLVPQGVFWEVPGFILAPLRLHFDRSLAPFGSISVVLGLVLVQN